MILNINDSARICLEPVAREQLWNIECLPRLEVLAKEQRIATAEPLPSDFLWTPQRQQSQHQIITIKSDSVV